LISDLQSDVLGRPKERVGDDLANIIELLLTIVGLCVSQVLLMSGPPGLGKTTLAHVVARQAGYEVFEINARSVSWDNHLHGILTRCDDAS
jgi:replication-associated recombination protein RarA